MHFPCDPIDQGARIRVETTRAETMNIAVSSLVGPHPIPPHLLVAPPPVVQDTPMERETVSEGVEADASPVDLMQAIAQRQDRGAFAALFTQFAPRIKAYVQRMGAEPRLAEDIAQDVMLTVWRRASQFNPEKAGVSTWIFTIARNRRIDIVRRERRPEFDATDPLVAPEAEPQPDEHVETAREHKRMHKAISTLPKEQANLLRLAFIEDKSHSVIAEDLNLPLGTVKSRIRLAIAKLRTLLKDDDR